MGFVTNFQVGLLRSGSFQSQSQSSGGQQNQDSGAPMGNCSLFVPDPRNNWYPSELGAPTSSGSQNNVRYAYFAGSQRLAVETGGGVWVYDTLDHQIGGGAFPFSRSCCWHWIVRGCHQFQAIPTPSFKV